MSVLLYVIKSLVKVFCSQNVRFLKSDQYHSLARLATEFGVLPKTSEKFVSFYLRCNNQWPIMHNVGGTEKPPIVYSYFFARVKLPNIIESEENPYCSQCDEAIAAYPCCKVIWFYTRAKN